MKYWKQASVVGCLCLALASFAQEALRTEVVSSLQAAIELNKDGKQEDAIARLSKVRALDNLNRTEKSSLEKMVVGLMLRTQDQARALPSLQYLVGAEDVTPAEKIRYLEAMVVINQKLKDHSAVVELTTKYEAMGGNKESIRVARYTALSELGRYQELAALLRPGIEKARAEGSALNLRDLKLYAIAQRHLGDQAGYDVSLQDLIQLDPKPDYAIELISRWQRQPQWSKLQIELLRLKKQVSPSSLSEMDYITYAEEALKVGLPAEAEMALSDGRAEGVIGKSINAQDLQSLTDRVKKTVMEDTKSFPAILKEAKTGADFEQLGEVYLSRADWDKAESSYLRAFELGGVKRSNLAWLHLAQAQCHVGEDDLVKVTLNKISPQGEAVGQIAGLWKKYCHL